MRLFSVAFMCISGIVFSWAVLQAAPQDSLQQALAEQWGKEVDGFPIHWGAPDRSQDPNRSLKPYAIDLSGRIPPDSGLRECVPEYGPTDGILIPYFSQWWSEVTTDCVAGLTGDPTRDEKAYVVVLDNTQKNAAMSQFTAAGADLSKVEFFVMPVETVWLTDYGPNCILLDGARAIVDSHYYILTRTLDNFTPTLIGEDEFQIPVFHMGMNTSAGGNFLPGPNRSAFITDTTMMHYNPDFTPQYIAEQYQAYLGIDTLHVFPELPTSVDLTGHIDMWMSLIDDDKVIISEFLPGSDPTAIQITDNAVTYMQGLGFTVFRTPDHNGPHPMSGNVQFTYTQNFRVNDRIFIPSYAGGDPTQKRNDDDALAIYQAALPNCEVSQVPCYDIIWAAGAMHCITTNVPRRPDAAPATHLLSPDGGELLVNGTNHELRWAATDDSAVTGIDLYYSLDGGLTFPHLIASGLENDSQEDWTVPSVPSPGDQAVVKVVANDGLGNSGEDVSETVFQICDALQTVYDFSFNGGVDRWAWGSEAKGWADLDGVRHPALVSTHLYNLDRLVYDRLAASDAAGGDNDMNRYRSVVPAWPNHSAHLFEFTIHEDPALIKDIGIKWEGYFDGCMHVEVYVWDDYGGNWSNGSGALGENMYMANYAGNRDDMLEGHIRSDFSHFMDNDGKLALLLFCEIPTLKSFHDYIGVTVTYDYPLKTDLLTLSESTGGAVNFTLKAGEDNASRNYILLGSASGSDPGVPLPGGMVTLPLVWDQFTDLVLAVGNSPVFQQFRGSLDSMGQSAAKLDSGGPLPPGLVGLKLYFAYTLYSPPWNYCDFVSNPVTIEIVP